MSLLKRNIVANLLGSVWLAGLTLLITPLQINLLGMEAFGLISFIATLQIVVSVLDLGLSTTITRELAGDQSEGKQASQPLLRTAITLYWGMALLIAFAFISASSEIAHAWFTSKEIDMDILKKGVQIVVLYIAIRWPVSVYVGVLAGVQRMGALNIIKVIVVSVRLVGGILVLLAWPKILVFLYWTAASAVFEVAFYALICKKIIPYMDWRPGFSWKAIRAVFSFSLGMNMLALISIGITQSDRLLISKMLPLYELGNYSLAYTAASCISLVIAALSSALMPAFASSLGSNEQEHLMTRYENGNRMMLFLTGLLFFPLFFFGEPILTLWVNAKAAQDAWTPLLFLSAGFWLSASVSSSYNIAVASRRIRLLVKISAWSAVFFVPTLYWLLIYWGIEGAALAWFVLNLLYALILVPIVHREVLRIPVFTWYTKILLPFALIGVMSYGSARMISDYYSPSQVYEILWLVPATIIYGGAAYLLLGESIRNDLIGMLRSLVGARKIT